MLAPPGQIPDYATGWKIRLYAKGESWHEVADQAINDTYHDLYCIICI